MTVNIDKLLRMGEQVIDNMRYTDDEDAVIQRVADHLQRFWDPRMKEAIKLHAEQHGEELSESLRAAVQRL